MVTRAVVLSVADRFAERKFNALDGLPDHSVYLITYKVLTRGRKKIRFKYFSAKDELDAYMCMVGWLREKGYKV
jgi:hypothetical protein